MPTQLPSPVTFRPGAMEDRALLEAVAAHQDETVSKLVAMVVRDYVRSYIEQNGGLAKIVEDNKKAAAAKTRSLQRTLNDLIAQNS